MSLFTPLLLFLLTLSASRGALLNQEGDYAVTDLFAQKRYGEIVRLARVKVLDSEYETLLVAKSYEKLGLIHQSNRVLRDIFFQKSRYRVYAAYLLGLNLSRQKDYSGAIRWYRNVIDMSGSGGSYLPSADRKAIAHAALMRLREIASTGSDAYEPALKALSKAASRFHVAHYHLGVLALGKGNLNGAAAAFIEIIRSGEDLAYTKRALEIISGDFRLVERAQSNGLQKQELVRLCLQQGLFRNALIVSYSIPYDADVARLRALCFYSMEDYAAAALLYGEYYAQYKDPEGLLSASLSYYKAGNKAQSRTFFYGYQKERKPDSPESPEAAVLKLRLEREEISPEDYLRNAGDFVRAQSSNPGSDRALQEAFYFTLVNKRPSLAVSYLKDAYGLIKDPLFRAWGSFVLALYLDGSYYDKAIGEFPGSYYYYMAAKNAVFEGDLVEKADELYSLGRFDEALASYIQLFSKGIGGSVVKTKISVLLGREPPQLYVTEIARLESGEESSILFDLYKAGLHEELAELLELALDEGNNREDMFYYYLLSRVSYDGHRASEGLRSAESMVKMLDQRYLIFLPAEILKLLYPDVYGEEINEYIAGSSIQFDPLLVLSIIREESRYNERAQSARGALGLMQILPSTARWIRKREIRNDDLFNPSLNIQTGILYLGYLTQRFDTQTAVLAAYNGGPGNVKKWLSSSSHGNEMKFVEEIPFAETRNYVKKVLTSYEMYQSLYATPHRGNNSKDS